MPLSGEQAEQATLAQYLDMLGVLWGHVPNEGQRHPAVGAKNKRAGVKRGMPDVLIFSKPRPDAPFVGVAIELKREGGGRLTPEQREWLEDLKYCGWHASVCHGAAMAIALLEALGYRPGPRGKGWRPANHGGDE